MTRPIRIEYAGALYHVTSRGDRQEDIYIDDVDRSSFLTLLAQVSKDYNEIKRNKGSSLALCIFKVLAY